MPLTQESLDTLDHFRNVAMERLDEQLDRLRALLETCGRPAEQALCCALVEVFDAEPTLSPGDRHLRGLLVFPNVDRFRIAIRLEQRPSDSGAPLQNDFRITVEDWNWSRGQHEQLIRVVVELYEGVPGDAPATRDGYNVFRAGVEDVLHDATAVASEIEGYLIREATKLLPG